jgi:hypothetical protein
VDRDLRELVELFGIDGRGGVAGISHLPNLRFRGAALLAARALDG